MTLKGKAIKGASWSFIGHIAQSVVSFIIGIILARMLSPDEYGLIGMAGVFIFITYVFVDSGFGTALIRKKECTDADYSTVFFLNLGISLFFFLLLFFSSEIIANFFGDSRLISIVRVLSFLIILYALSIVNRSILVKKIDLKTLNILQISAQILSGFIGIYLAYKGYGVWSLVWKTLLNQIILNIQFWLVNKWFPSLTFSKTILSEMFSFSSKLLLSGILNKAYEQIYTIVIGKFFSSYDLGLFTKAKQFNSLPSESLTGSVLSVSFPVFAQLQNDIPRMKRVSSKMLSSAMFVNVTAMIGMAAIAENLILFTLGEQWLGAVYILQLLCIQGIFFPFNPINLNIITALGRSDIFLKLEVIKKIIAVPVIIAGIIWGLKFMLIGMIFSSFLAVLINAYYTKRLIDYGIYEQLKDAAGSVALAFFMGISVFLIGYAFGPSVNKFFILIVQILLGIFIISFFAYVFKMRDIEVFRNLLKDRFLKGKKGKLIDRIS